MKPKYLFLSTYDNDGGAIAVFLTFIKALYEYGEDVALVVKYKTTSYPFVYQALPSKSTNRITRIFKRKKTIDYSIGSDPKYHFYKNDSELNYLGDGSNIIAVCPFKPTYIITSLISSFVNATTLASLINHWNAKCYMIGYDANIYTGGCHVLWNCKGYTMDCSNCPAINQEKRNSLEKSFKCKKNIIQNAGIGIMYAGAWAEDKIRRSSIFANQMRANIGMCVDTDIFTNSNREIAKQVFGISPNRFVILSGAEDLLDMRKGLSLLIEAYKYLGRWLKNEKIDNVSILFIGKNSEAFNNLIRNETTCDLRFIKFITDERLLSLAYQASDVFVCPSIEDAGPSMVPQALACGTPIVSFKTGLMVDNSLFMKENVGYISNDITSESLFLGIQHYLLLSEDEKNRISNLCRVFALNQFSITNRIKRFLSFTQYNL